MLVSSPLYRFLLMLTLNGKCKKTNANAFAMSCNSEANRLSCDFFMLEYVSFMMISSICNVDLLSICFFSCGCDFASKKFY